MDKEELKRITYSVFSDTKMTILALIAVFMLAIEFLKLDPLEILIIGIVDGLILFAFFLEFVLKVYVEQDRVKYLKTHKFDSAVSIIIILSPIAALFTEQYAASTILRLFRASRILLSAGTTARIVRIGAYLLKYVNANIISPIRDLFQKKQPWS